MELWLDDEEESLLRLANELTLSAAGDVGASGCVQIEIRMTRCFANGLAFPAAGGASSRGWVIFEKDL
eukprot:1156647-Pelagomonas_calceolata.AAC.10